MFLKFLLVILALIQSSFAQLSPVSNSSEVKLFTVEELNTALSSGQKSLVESHLQNILEKESDKAFFKNLFTSISEGELKKYQVSHATGVTQVTYSGKSFATMKISENGAGININGSVLELNQFQTAEAMYHRLVKILSTHQKTGHLNFLRGIFISEANAFLVETASVYAIFALMAAASVDLLRLVSCTPSIETLKTLDGLVSQCKRDVTGEQKWEETVAAKYLETKRVLKTKVDLLTSEDICGDYNKQYEIREATTAFIKKRLCLSDSDYSQICSNLGALKLCVKETIEKKSPGKSVNNSGRKAEPSWLNGPLNSPQNKSATKK